MRQQAGVVTGDGGICFIVLGEKLKEGSRRTSSEVLPEGDAPPGAGTAQFILSEFVLFRKEEPQRALPSLDRDRTDRNSREKRSSRRGQEVRTTGGEPL